MDKDDAASARPDPGCTVLAAMVQARFDSMTRLGACPASLIDRSGFDPRGVDNPDKRVPLETEYRLWRAARELVPDPAFALKIGAMSDPRQMGIVGQVALSSATLRDAGNQFARYGRLINDRMAVTEREADGMYSCRYRPDCPEALEPEFVELFFSTAITLCRCLSGVDIVPEEMRFRHGAPAYLDEYARLFRCRLYFGQPENSMTFDVRYQDLPLPSHNLYAHGLFVRHASPMLESLRQEDDFPARVRQFIVANIADGKANSTLCAAALRVSERTLQRRLSERKTSFAALMDRTRRRLAFDYLEQGKLSTTDVAFLLGYSEVSAFHRAFKRWTGAGPAAYRRPG